MTEPNIQQFLGGTPGKVVLRLALISLLVGVLLATFGFTPWGFFHFIRMAFEELVGSGMEAVHKIAGYVVSGAMIVLPIWLIVRFLSSSKNPPA